MMKGIILMVCLWTVKSYAECPSDCNCTTTSVLCINQDFESIPVLFSLDFYPVILDFSGNQLLSIDQTDFYFPECDEVKEVYLNNSGISDIGQGTFDKLENLQELYLGQNFLSTASFSTKLIETLENMVLLDMSNNYFNDDMPIIRSESLEVLALVNSKISYISKDALQFLPNLKLLLLQQNNIQHLSFEPFQKYSINPVFLKLTFNPWKCSCANLQAFYLLGNMKFLDTSEIYQCTNTENEITNIFNSVGSIETLPEGCDINDELETKFIGYQEVRDMVNEEVKNFKNLELKNESVISSEESYEDSDNDDSTEFNIKEMNSADIAAPLPENCWGFLSDAYNNNTFFTVVVLITISSFFVGFVAGIICCKVVYTFRYKKLEQSSDSQVQLLRA